MQENVWGVKRGARVGVMDLPEMRTWKNGNEDDRSHLRFVLNVKYINFWIYHIFFLIFKLKAALRILQPLFCPFRTKRK